jgi:signal transduction histidine kinase
MELSSFEEGELSILQSEITKLVLHIREQNAVLKSDKQLLADSLADIAHQLRTPLTSVNLILSLLAKTPDEEEKKASIREIEVLLSSMDWLITSLLKLSRLDAKVVEFQTGPVNLAELVESAQVALAIPLELRAIEVRTTLSQDAVVKGDFRWLSEAVQNILKNCMESIGENGSIEIASTDNILYTELTIRDSGSGFKQDELPFLFDRFYRGENANATGFGIGLALSKKIITGQNGRITAKNHADGGALFSIRFYK